MTLRLLAVVFIVAAMSTPVDVQVLGAPGTCPSDVKLLNGGPTRVFGEGPGTWWGLVMNGLLVAGFVEEHQQIAYLNHVFGTSFTTLEELKAFNLQNVESVWDENRNGYVCAFDLNGTRAHFDNPYVDLTFFGISDDRISQ